MDDTKDKVFSDTSATNPEPQKKKKFSNKAKVLSDLKDVGASNDNRNDVPKKKKRKCVDDVDIGSNNSLSNANVPRKKKKNQASGEGVDLWDSTADNIALNMEENKTVSSKDIDINIDGRVGKTTKGSEKNFTKANKKNKKRAKKKSASVLVTEATIVLPLEENTETQEGLSTTNGVTNSKTRKKRKSNESNLVTKSGNAMDNGVLPQKEKKKKKENKVIENGITGVLEPQKVKKKKKKFVSETSNEVRKNETEKTDDIPKKKKNKEKPKKNSDLTQRENEVIEVFPQQTKKKKKKCLSEKCDEENMNDTDVPQKEKKKRKAGKEENTEVTQSENGAADVLVTKQEKKKKKIKCVTDITESAGTSEVTAKDKASGIATSKKKKKVTASALEDEVIILDDEHSSESSKTDKTEKKKKRVLLCEEPQGSQILLQNVSDTDSSQGLDGNSTKEVDGVQLKKKINEDKEWTGSDRFQNRDSHPKKDKKMSKKKKEKQALVNKEQETAKALNDIPQKKEEIISKDKTTRSSEQEDAEEVQVVFMKPGNEDEVQIDTSTKFGQWDSATFQSTEQQTKFFKLLGGFKKGNQTAMSPSSIQRKPNMALGKEGEQTLERNLLAEFDQALVMKQHKGVGLGFQLEQKKAFYIDKAASKSVKFKD